MTDDIDSTEIGPSKPGADVTSSTTSHSAHPARRRFLHSLRRRWPLVVVLALLVISAALMGVAIGYGVWGSSGAATAQGPANGGSVPGGQNGPPYNYGGPYGNEPPYGYGPGSGGSSGSGSNASGGPSNASAIAAAVSPGLVDINVTLAYGGGEGAATGIVLSPSGEVLTNNHVIEGASTISATDVGNGKTYQATVVGYDLSHDIAVLQLSGSPGLRTVPLGDSSKVRVGEAVVAIGNAGGAGGKPSVAGGSVVALNQQITAGDVRGSEQLSGLIEVNATVAPGDSGGPLVDGAGRAIGVNVAAAASYRFRTAGGRGYAVPVNQALAIAKQIESGPASNTVHIGPTAFLGVELAPSTAEGGYGQGGGTSTSGALIAGVLSGSPAARAKLANGDVITSLDGEGVNSAEALTSLIAQHRPGDQVKVGWLDSSGRHNVSTVQLIAGPPQ